MTESHARESVMEYVAAAARRYASASGDDPEDIAQRILARVSRQVRGGLAPWPHVVCSVRQALAEIKRFDGAAKRSHVGWVAVGVEGVAEKQGITDQQRVELRLDLEACLARESESIRTLCRLLQTMTLAEAALAMGVPRSTLQGWLASLRERLEAKGLGRAP